MSKYTQGPWEPTMRIPDGGLRGVSAVAICACMGPDAVANARLIVQAPARVKLVRTALGTMTFRGNVAWMGIRITSGNVEWTRKADAALIEIEGDAE